jgi:ubiquinone/menaquinone biosynthesis C-methylase UbiE
VGTNRGYQTCFRAAEYDTAVIVGIDPWREALQQLRRNASEWGVEGKIRSLQASVPDTPFRDESFDRVYATTVLEMIRGMDGESRYRACLDEIYRVLEPGGPLGLGEPMHRDVEIPAEIYDYVTTGDMPAPWSECFATVEETVWAVESAGFTVLDAGEASDARLWWDEYGMYDPDASEEYDLIQRDDGRWVTYGYVIANKSS